MNDYDTVPVIQAAKRLGLEWTPWMDDWFVSWSPRNDNSNGEGYWEHWVGLAVAILQHPFTELVAPQVFESARAVPTPEPLYSGAHRVLTEEELAAVLRPGKTP